MGALQDYWIVQDIILPTLDVLLLSYLIYRGYQVLVQTRAIQLIQGALMLGALYAVSFFLGLRTVLWIINLLAPSFVIGIAIIFQPELRKIFTRIGQGMWNRMRSSTQSQQIEAVVSVARTLSGKRRGALIVFSRSVGQKSIIETGTVIDGELSFPYSPRYLVSTPTCTMEPS